MKENKIVNVAVHKATINLVAGESIGDFTSALRDALRQHVTKGMAKGDHMWMVEVFAAKAVYEVYKSSNEAGGGPTEEYWSVDWKREKGVFSFGSSTEVQRHVAFKPKPGMSITKNDVDGWVEKSLWGNVI